MPRSLRIGLVGLAATALLLVASPASAAPGNGQGQQGEHERIVQFWTPDRVAKAKPRELLLPDPGAQGRGGPNAPAPDAQRKPGGSSATTVTGSYWSGGGLVKATTGRVLFSFNGADYWVCSGSVVTDARLDVSVVLTAGHCVYDDVANVFATNWMFVPDYEDQKTFDCLIAKYGCWTAQSLVTTNAWAASDFNEDYAFAVMRPGGRSGTAQLDSTVGAHGISFDTAHPTQVYAFGYPQGAPYNGQRLAYCAGTDIADPYRQYTDFGVKCNMTGGSSGGPWFAPFTTSSGDGVLTSVNSFKYASGPYGGYMFGPRFDADTAATYAAAQTATTENVLVGP